MMGPRFRHLVCALSLLGSATIGYAATDCAGATAAGGGFCLWHGDFSTVGGIGVADGFALAATSMYPYQRKDTAEQLQAYYDRADTVLIEGRQARNDLLGLTDNFAAPDCSSEDLVHHC